MCSSACLQIRYLSVWFFAAALRVGFSRLGCCSASQQCIRRRRHVKTGDAHIDRHAAKYTSDGEHIVLDASRDKNGSPSITVRDNGVGITAEDMGHIFDRFYRADPSRARTQGGTGLGLAIAKWIVDCHDGYFDVVSREGFGTRMTIHLKALPPK
ncbi:MAG: ATP-binding protein [Oscillospiraceae bacterium]